MSLRLTDEQNSRLEELAQAEDGLTPSNVVEDAKDPTSPLHALFEWNDAKAAERQRLDTARLVIRSRAIVMHSEVVTLRIPFYTRDPEKPSRTQGYISTLSLRDNPQAARDKVIAETARAESSLLRARGFAQVLGQEGPFNDLLDRLRTLVLSIAPQLEDDDEAPVVPPNDHANA